MARAGNGEHESALHVFDLVFSDDVPTGNRFLLLVKVCAYRTRCCLYRNFLQAIILFECGKQHDAISRVDYLIDIVSHQSLYITVRVRER